MSYKRGWTLSGYLLQSLHGEVDAATGSSQGHVLLGGGLHLCHYHVRFLHLAGHLRRFLLQGLQVTDDAVVVQDLAFRGIQGLEQGLLQVSKFQLEFTWKTHIYSVYIHVHVHIPDHKIIIITVLI